MVGLIMAVAEVNFTHMLSTFFVLIVVVGDGLSVLARLTVAFLLLVDRLKLGCFD